MLYGEIQVLQAIANESFHEFSPLASLRKPLVKWHHGREAGVALSGSYFLTAAVKLTCHSCHISKEVVTRKIIIAYSATTPKNAAHREFTQTYLYMKPIQTDFHVGFDEMVGHAPPISVRNHPCFSHT